MMNKDEDEEWLINIEYAIWLADSIGDSLKKEKKEKIFERGNTRNEFNWCRIEVYLECK